MRLTTRLAAPLAALALLATAASAQKPEKVPERPQLAAGQDTNSAFAYYQHGRAKIGKHAEEAAAAFYWASRLAPNWADPYYARRIALLMTDKRNLVRYWFGDRGVVESAKYVAIDSLQYQALLRNPFVVQSLDRVLVDELVYELSDRSALPMYGGRSGDPASDGWQAYVGGQYGKAVEYYGAAIKRRPKEPLLHAARARAYAALGQYAAAADELSQLLGKLDEKQKKKLVWFFDSRVMYEYSMGMAHALAGADSAAREAFGRALSEDLSFYMAHAALGDLALRAGDVATARSEYQLAVQLREDDAALRFGYALALVQAGKGADAAEQLRKAIELEPYFALPWLYLGRLFDASEMPDQAAQHYEGFLARASSDLEERGWAEQRLAQLKSAATPATTPD